MAIPNRTTIICPSCKASEDVTIGDSSIGPGGRVSDRPIYSLLPRPMWAQTARGGEVFVSCNTCGAQDFASLADLVRRPLRHPAGLNKPSTKRAPE